jgi:DNA-binding transcriptional regulator YhcF (GntR family)
MIMKQQNFFDFINVDGRSSTPKYIQLASSIQEAVYAGKLNSNYTLPSLQELTCNLEISKETADRGYKYLRQLGVLSSVPGKGHYITNVNMVRQPKVFLLLNRLSSDKKVFYDAFASALGEPVVIDFYIYNDDFALFRNLISTRREGYTHYVILPHFAEGGENAHELINTIPKDKLILLDKPVKGVNGNYGCVLEDFNEDIYTALNGALEQLSKYDTLKLVFPKNGYFPAEIANGFNLFCQQYAFERCVINTIDDVQVNKGQVFICLGDDDLVILIEKIKQTSLKVGQDVGIISYNETPLKKYILNGITTISADFEQMGKKAARMILGNRMEQVMLNCHINLRQSL